MTMANDSLESAKLVQVVGRYALYDAIGYGGMASVHLGLLLGPVGFTRVVAIKRLHAHVATDPEFVSMFLDEARLAARVRHPNVVQTLDVVASDGGLFVVMELVQGETLARLVRASKARGEIAPPKIVGAIVSGALHGLHAAHEARNARGEPLGLVHRDVSPQNVLVGIDGVARVLDFGVAKAVGRVQESRAGQLKGKLSYMAPEQLLGRTTRTADIYAASVVLWEALTGQRLFDGEDQAMVLSKLMAREIPAPSSVNPQLSKEIDALVMRGLAREPTERFATADEMARAVEAVVGVVTPSEVGHWVETVAKDALHNRLRRVEALESVEVASLSNVCLSPDEGTVCASFGAGILPSEERATTRLSVEEPPIPSVAKEESASRHRWRSAFFFVPAVSLLVGLGTVAHPGAQSSTLAAPATSAGLAWAVDRTSNLEALPSVSHVEAMPEAALVSDYAAEIPSSAPEAKRTSAPRAPRSPKVSGITGHDARRQPAPAAAVPDCSIPYTIDAAGIRHPRAECL
jgi:serine/threonine-protein kinase